MEKIGLSDQDFASAGIVGLKDIRPEIAMLARQKGHLIISGETGVGKDTVANAVHQLGPRRDSPCVRQGIPGISTALLESELFGHVRGAFTGAHATREGLFIAAEGGTIILDEIGDLAVEMQAKLLGVLEEGTIRRVGQNCPKSTDARVIVTTNRDLQQKVEDGTFRKDLLFRLDQFSLNIPPLRERREDIKALAQHFLKKFGDNRIVGFSPDAEQLLLMYDWPGNVRELSNVISRVCGYLTGQASAENTAQIVITKDDVMKYGKIHIAKPIRMEDESALIDLLSDLMEYILHGDSREETQKFGMQEIMRLSVMAVLLVKTGGHKGQTADIFGTDQRTVYRYLAILRDKFQRGDLPAFLMEFIRKHVSVIFLKDAV